MVQEITTQSWFSRIGGAFAGILIGIALIIGSFALIFWNEGQGLHTAQSLRQTQQVLISVPNTPIDKNNNLKVVYFSGTATTGDTIKDSLLDISAKAIRIERHVKMYQWEQHEETKTESEIGGSEKKITTYTYHPVWSSTLIDSTGFKEAEGHKNPVRMPIQSMQIEANKVTVGDFTLPPELVEKISKETTVDLSAVNTAKIQTKTKLKVQQDNHDLYLGSDMQNPQIGDAKITLVEILPQTVSVIAQQSDNTLQPYVAPAGKPIEMLVSGQQSSAQMIQDAQRENAMMIWILRVASLILMIIGISLIFRPIIVLADIIPLFGSIVGFGVGIIAFLGGLILWTIGTAIAWFAVRPLFAIALIVLVALTCYYVILSRKNLVKKG